MGNERMALDLGDPDLTVDIVPDGKTRFNEGISRNLGESEVHFDCQGVGRLFPQRSHRIEPMK